MNLEVGVGDTIQPITVDGALGDCRRLLPFYLGATGGLGRIRVSAGERKARPLALRVCTEPSAAFSS